MKDVYVKIIQKLGPTSFVIKCAFCDGKGRRPETMARLGNMGKWVIAQWNQSEACPVCDGKGSLRVESDDLLIVDSRCFGTGHEPDEFTWDPVFVEKGFQNKDYYLSRSAVRLCDTCSGVGARSLTGSLKVIK